MPKLILLVKGMKTLDFIELNYFEKSQNMHFCKSGEPLGETDSFVLLFIIWKQR